MQTMRKEYAGTGIPILLDSWNRSSVICLFGVHWGGYGEKRDTPLCNYQCHRGSLDTTQARETIRSDEQGEHTLSFPQGCILFEPRYPYDRTNLLTVQPALWAECCKFWLCVYVLGFDFFLFLFSLSWAYCSLSHKDIGGRSMTLSFLHCVGTWFHTVTILVLRCCKNRSSTQR